jgi:TolB-like protein/DNA-binding winged helix-turn-helix (wHTH) protein
VEVLSAGDIFLFDRFRLDRRGLFQMDGDAAPAPVEIGSRALDVLRVLLERPGDLVSRDEIMAAAWPGMVVEDNNLNVQISTLRRVLDQSREQGSCIQTMPGRGYRFVVPVTRSHTVDSPVSAPPSDNGSGRSITNNEPAQGRAARARQRLWGGVIASVLGALITVAVAGPWRVPWWGNSHPAPRLSIVVLPFANLSGDPDQQYFADGITEDVTTDLSRIVDMFVISRNTAFTYRNKPVDTKQIGRELGVRYVLDGSVQRSGNQVRVHVQLIDAESDAHLWAARFDRETADLFALQNEITGQIAYALGPRTGCRGEG